jgi:hypothetical protein
MLRKTNHPHKDQVQRLIPIKPTCTASSRQSSSGSAFVTLCRRSALSPLAGLLRVRQCSAIGSSSLPSSSLPLRLFHHHAPPPPPRLLLHRPNLQPRAHPRRPGLHPRTHPWHLLLDGDPTTTAKHHLANTIIIWKIFVGQI